MKAFKVSLLHFKVDKMNRGVIFTKKTPWKLLEKPGFPGIPGKFSSLLVGLLSWLFYCVQSRTISVALRTP
jgi:hypothetical protein